MGVARIESSFRRPRLARSLAQEVPVMSPRSLAPLRVLCLAAFVAAIVGCSKNSPTEPNPATQQDADDAAQIAALAMSSDHGGATPTQGSAAMSPRATATPMRAFSTLGDTTFTAGAVTWTLSRTFYDAGNNEQGAYNPLTTVRVAGTARGVGAIETASDTASFGSAGNLDIVGISVLQDSLITNATRNDTLQCAFTPFFRNGRVHLYVENAGTLANVVSQKPLPSWPKSGTGTWSLKVDRLRSSDRGDVERHFECVVVVNYNGTRYPPATVTGGFRYSFDLKTGAIARR
jgi:hypothetical protein